MLILQTVIGLMVLAILVLRTDKFSVQNPMLLDLILDGFWARVSYGCVIFLTLMLVFK